MKNPQVIRFTVTLSGYSRLFPELIYSRITSFLISSDFHDFCTAFLASLGQELPSELQFDIFHNKYFNYTKQNDFQIVIPSRFYKFDDKTPEVDTVAFEPDPVSLESFPQADCIINTSSSRQLTNVLKLIQKIQRCMHLFTSSFVISGKPTGPGVRFDGFMNRDILTTLIRNTVRFHENTKRVAVAFCYLSQPAFHHIVRQLRQCHQMEDLRLCFIEQMIPLDLGKSLCRMQSLRNVEIEGCCMTKEVCNKLLLGISTCFQLQKLNLSCSALTNPLKPFLEVLPKQVYRLLRFCNL